MEKGGKVARSGGLARDGFMTFAFLALLGLFAWKLNKPVETLSFERFSVIDGDSLASGEQRFRLRGIDAPELRQQCRREGLSWDCGVAARAALGQLLPGGRAECRGGQRDRYDRLLVTCVAGGLEVNREMVRRGMAVSYGEYQADEAAAKAAKVGLWAGSFERPRDYRQDGGVTARRGDDPLAAVGDTIRGWIGWP